MRRFLDPDIRNQHDSCGNAPHLMSDRDRARVFTDDVEPDWERVSGACTCQQCGQLYYDHPSVVGALWLTRLCDDTLVKL